MKAIIYTINLLTFTFTLLISLPSQTIIFTDHTATGSEDGSSWENAYTDLTDALEAAVEGDEIWVAQGVYLPGGDNPVKTSSFLIDKNIKLYGGFSGTETSFDERDFENNETVLSGDILNDDVDGDFFNNKEDNVWHVVFVTDTVDNRTVIDGFTVRNGRAEGVDGAGDERRGGGILSYGGPVVTNCYFTQNYAWFGGGFYPRASAASGFRLENCLFEVNWGGNGAAMYIVSLTDGQLTQNSFISNRAENNAGGIYIQASEVEISQCQWRNNICAGGRGGGIYVTESEVSIDDSEFLMNSSIDRTGGGIHFNASQYSITNSEFLSNQARWGAAITTYDTASIGQITNTIFNNNSSEVSGGALSIGFHATVEVDDCLFRSNSANFGGAVFLQNDFSNIQMSNSLIEENSAESFGGGIHGSSGQMVSLYHTELTGNFSGRFGGAINVSEDSLDISTLTLDRCRILGNLAGEQGGGLNVSDNDVMIVNSLFLFNTVESGPGGAISNNGTDSLGANIFILNSSLANNSADLGAGISNWTSPEGSASITLQNTVLHNPSGSDYEIEDGQPGVFSLGGNFSSDNSLNEVLIETNDLLEADPLFNNPDFFDFTLSEESPCVDHGINDGAPDIDIDGNERDDMVDQGAFEYQKVSSIVEQEKRSYFYLYPTISRGLVKLEIRDPQSLNGGEIVIYNLKGQVIRQLRWTSNSLTGGPQNIDVSDLSDGKYFLRLLDGSISRGVKSFLLQR